MWWSTDAPRCTCGFCPPTRQSAGPPTSAWATSSLVFRQVSPYGDPLPTDSADLSLVDEQVARRVANLSEHTRSWIRDQITSALSQHSDCAVAKPDLQVSLTCPVSLKLLQVPARFADCTHIQCFDAGAVIKMYMSTTDLHDIKCPLCGTYYGSLTSILRNTYFEDVLKYNRLQSRLAKEVWIRPDGTYYFSNAAEGATVASGTDGREPRVPRKYKKLSKVIDVELDMTIAGFPDVEIEE